MKIIEENDIKSSKWWLLIFFPLILFFPLKKKIILHFSFIGNLSIQNEFSKLEKRRVKKLKNKKMASIIGGNIFKIFKVNHNFRNIGVCSYWSFEDYYRNIMKVSWDFRLQISFGFQMKRKKFK